jgi:hypothetical protein
MDREKERREKVIRLRTMLLVRRRFDQRLKIREPLTTAQTSAPLTVALKAG